MFKNIKTLFIIDFVLQLKSSCCLLDPNKNEKNLVSHGTLSYWHAIYIYIYVYEEYFIHYQILLYYLYTYLIFDSSI